MHGVLGLMNLLTKNETIISELALAWQQLKGHEGKWEWFHLKAELCTKKCQNIGTYPIWPTQIANETVYMLAFAKL